MNASPSRATVGIALASRPNPSCTTAITCRPTAPTTPGASASGTGACSPTRCPRATARAPALASAAATHATEPRRIREAETPRAAIGPEGNAARVPAKGEGELTLGELEPGSGAALPVLLALLLARIARHVPGLLQGGPEGGADQH